MRRLHRILEPLSALRPKAVREPRSTARMCGSHLLVAGVVAALAACESPRWNAAVTPGDATLLVDGKRKPAASIDEVIPYYGVVAINGVPRADQSPPRLATRSELLIEEPVTPWIFPLDFPVEMAQVMFAPVPDRTVRIGLERREDVPLSNTEPRGLDEFRARAQTATTGR